MKIMIIVETLCVFDYFQVFLVWILDFGFFFILHMHVLYTYTYDIPLDISYKS